MIQGEWVQNFGGAVMIVGMVWVDKLFNVITHVVSSYVNLSEQTKVFTQKKFNSYRTGLWHQHGRCFIVLGHQYGRRDVTLYGGHDVKTLYIWFIVMIGRWYSEVTINQSLLTRSTQTIPEIFGWRGCTHSPYGHWSTQMWELSEKNRKEKKQGLYGTTALYCLDPLFPLSADNLHAGRCEILVSNKTLS